MTASQETVRAAAKVIQEAEAGEQATVASEVRLSNGLRLGLRPVPTMLVRKAVAAIRRPAVPKVYLEDKGREEENPDDPAYQEAVSDWEGKTFDVGANVLLAAGTKALEPLPTDMAPPESEEWLEIIQSLGIEVDVSNKHSRYLTWLTCYAIPTMDDLMEAIRAVGRRSGIEEAEVDDAVASFRNRAQRRAAGRGNGQAENP